MSSADDLICGEKLIKLSKYTELSKENDNKGNMVIKC